MSNQQINSTEVTTGEVRLSYVHLFKPRETDTGLKYGVTVLLPKADVAAKQRIDAAMAVAIQQGVKDKWNGVRPPVVPLPIHDGDGTKQDGTPYGPECKGHWVFSASQSADRGMVEVVDANLNPIINQSEVYSGMYGRVLVRFYAYAAKGKKGIGCGLGPVQKLRDGEPLAGMATSATQAFGGATMAQPQQVQQPVYQAPVQQQQVYQAPAQQQYAQPAQPAAAPAIDPITGQPVQPPVMGL